MELFKEYTMRKRKIKKRLEKRKKHLFLKFTIIISSLSIIYSGIYIFLWTKDNYNTNKELIDIKNNTPITKIHSEKEKEKSFNPYKDFPTINYLEVDFSNLIEKNPETVAWIVVNNTNINYPVVQHNDNKYYLNHSFNKQKNDAGWIFMDYRNNIKNMEKNTIIYAHGRQDGSMFGNLKNTLKDKWYKNTNNHIINLSTKHENMLWQIFSIYKIKTTNDYIQTDFQEETSFNNFLTTITNRSIYNFKTPPRKTDNILTLSTCYNEKEKVVIHAKLIKTKQR